MQGLLRIKILHMPCNQQGFKTSNLLVFARRLDTTDHTMHQIYRAAISLYTIVHIWILAGTMDVPYMIRLPLSLHSLFNIHIKYPLNFLPSCSTIYGAVFCNLVVSMDLTRSNKSDSLLGYLSHKLHPI